MRQYFCCSIFWAMWQYDVTVTFGHFGSISLTITLGQYGSIHGEITPGQLCDVTVRLGNCGSLMLQ